jgi:hypothetical protein
MLTILEDMGIPVGVIVLTKDKKTYAIDNEYYYILMNKLSGSNIADIHWTSCALFFTYEGS